MITIDEKREMFDSLKKLIAEYLKECDSDITPYVCEMQKTKAGYEEIEQFVLNLMFLEGYTVGAAIMVKERQLNPSLLNDTF